MSFRIIVLSGYVPRSGIAGSYVNCLIAFQWSLLCLVKDGLEKVKSGYGESLRRLFIVAQVGPVEMERRGQGTKMFLGSSSQALIVCNRYSGREVSGMFLARAFGRLKA